VPLAPTQYTAFSRCAGCFFTLTPAARQSRRDSDLLAIVVVGKVLVPASRKRKEVEAREKGLARIGSALSPGRGSLFHALRAFIGNA
jgi:hypothetical protein